jgi:hypothetical protein
MTAGAAVFAYTPTGMTVRALLGPDPHRLLPAVQAHETGGSHAFIRTGSDGQPVTFDPCLPVRIVHNPAMAPPGARALLDEALEEVSLRTGLRLEVVGSTDERPNEQRAAKDRGRYGTGWSPVLLAWSTAEETPGLAGDIAGLGGSIAQAPPFTSYLRFVSGSVTLDAVDLREALEGPDGPAQVRAIVLHELAHLVGLDHVDDPGELMHPENLGRTAFGPGDIEGLARLGSGRCLP